MRLEVERSRLKIVPETPQDEAMLEEVFLLREEGDSAPLVRRNAGAGINAFCWGYAEVRARPRGDEPTSPVACSKGVVPTRVRGPEEINAEHEPRRERTE